ncbi:zf-TFIIB domain-containing protein [Leifsonia sp. NPDC014704]|uniref:TFIIB-type zinc ribbon-containing protein n=1 Tax=Leifsonia sp. NPDC014704 TaxID=3364123 RepID=UPI000EB12D4E
MKCPVDGATLVLADRSGIEIDYCPDCRGVWLDRGELDKIIDRSLGQAPEAYGPVPLPQQPYPQGGYDKHGAGHDSSGHGSRGGHGSQQQYGNSKRRGGWLGELFGD